MKRIITLILVLTGWTLQSSLFAQAETNSASQKAAEFLATNAKYHVVVAVLIVIFSGLVVYGFILNRKISKLEANQK
jgi:hypothetical protein